MNYHFPELIVTLYFDGQKQKYMDFVHSDKSFLSIHPELIDIFPLSDYGLTKDSGLAVIRGVIDRDLAPYCYDRVVTKSIPDDVILKYQYRNALAYLHNNDWLRKFHMLLSDRNKQKVRLVINSRNSMSPVIAPALPQLKYYFLCADVVTADLGGVDLIVEDIDSSWIKCPKCYFYHANSNNHELCDRCYKVEILAQDEEYRYI
jgi:hypothetical protein